MAVNFYGGFRPVPTHNRRPRPTGQGTAAGFRPGQLPYGGVPQPREQALLPAPGREQRTTRGQSSPQSPSLLNRVTQTANTPLDFNQFGKIGDTRLKGSRFRGVNPIAFNRYQDAPNVPDYRGGPQRGRLRNLNAKQFTSRARQGDLQYGPDRGTYTNIGELAPRAGVGQFQGLDTQGLPGRASGPQRAQYGNLPGRSQYGNAPARSNFHGLDDRIAALPQLANRSTDYIRDRRGLASGIENDLNLRRGQYGELRSSLDRRRRDLDERAGHAQELAGGLDRREQQVAERDRDRQRRLGDRQRRLDQYGNIDRDFALTQDFGGERQRVEQSQYQRALDLLSPQLQQEEQQLRSRLVSQGLPEGSQAYQDAMSTFSRQRANQLSNLALGAVEAGGREQSRMSDLLSRNRQQLFGEQGTLFGEGGALEAEASRRFGEGNQFWQNQRELFADRGQLENERARGFQEGRQVFDAGGDIFQNALQSADFSERLNRAQEDENQRSFGRDSQVRGQLYGEQRDAVNVLNQNERDLFDQGMQLARLGDQRQNQMFGQGMQLAGMGDRRQDTMFGQGMQLADLDFRNRGQGMQEQLAQAGLLNQNQRDLFNQQFQNRGQSFQEQLAQANIANQNQDRLFGQGMQLSNLNNQNRQQMFDNAFANRGQSMQEQMALANIANQNQQTRFGQGMQLANMLNQNRDRTFNQGMQAAAFDNANLNNLYNQRMQSADMHNQNQLSLFNQRNIMRNQGIREMMMQRQQPFQDLNAMMALAGPAPQMPMFQERQWGAQAPNYMGAQSNFLNQQNQQNNANAGMWGRLAGQGLNWWQNRNAGQAPVGSAGHQGFQLPWQQG